MNIEDVSRIFREEVKAWADGRSLTIGFDNLPFDRPEDALHAMLSVLPGDSVQVEAGDLKRWRTAGITLLRVFLPYPNGEEPIHQTIDSFCQTFRSQTLQSTVVIRTARATKVGRAGKWWQWNVTLPWYYDVTGS